MNVADERPAERYQPSARSYQAIPRPWEYPEGSLVRRLNAAGCLDWEGRRWFVCEALAGRPVCIEKAANLLLVSYRHMYVREIDRERNQTHALVQPRHIGRAFRSGPPGSANMENQEPKV